MKRISFVLAIVGLAAAAIVVSVTFSRKEATPLSVAEVFTGAPDENGNLAVLSRSYRLDRIYRSMEGPFSPQPGLRLQNKPGRKLVWLTGLETEVVDAQSIERISQEFLCHSNLTFDKAGGTPDLHNLRFKNKTHLDWRLFTIVPGRLSIHLPEGFGMPVPSGATLDYLTMSLNLNVRDRVVDVRMRSKIYSIPDGEPGAPTKALFRKALYVLQPRTATASDTPAVLTGAPRHVGAGCADMCSVNLSAVSTVGSIGEGMTLHWLVPPGRHTFRTEIASQLGLPFDTTIHYATFHIHPYGKSFELRDLTTGETVFSLNSRDWTDRVGVAHVDEVKSQEGIPISRSHRYESVVEYDNTTDHEIDAMGILYLYLLEKDFVPNSGASRVASVTGE
jgi:hypothetical protein